MCVSSFVWLMAGLLSSYASVVDATDNEKLGRCGCVPQSGCPALVPKAHGVIRGRAPGAVRCEILF
jgi:hypothetical protein